MTRRSNRQTGDAGGPPKSATVPAPLLPTPGRDVQTRPARRAPPPSSHEKQSVALLRGLSILEFIAGSPEGSTLTAIAARLALPEPTVFRLLKTLLEAAYVRQRPTGEWCVGVRAFRVGAAFLVHQDPIDRVHDHLVALVGRTEETCSLVVLDTGEAVTVDEVPCQRPIRFVTRAGARSPLHASAGGKAMLAWLDTIAVDNALRLRGMEARTRRTIVERADLVEELARTRQRGYAVDDQERVAGLTGVAGVLWNEAGEPWAAIVVEGPSSRLTPARIDALGRLVRDAAVEISDALGGRSPPKG